MPKSAPPLPDGLTWAECNIEDEECVREIFKFLSAHYVGDSRFRYRYSPDFLRWALTPPRWRKDWHLCLRDASGKLVGFISAIPTTIKLHSKQLDIAEVNFLCLDASLRYRKLAPVLIQTLTFRVTKSGVSQAVYTAGLNLSPPISQARMFHRSLNTPKMVRTGFIPLHSGMDLQTIAGHYSLPDSPGIKGIRIMQEQDLGGVLALLEKSLSEQKLGMVFKTTAEAAHWLLPRDGVINSYVVESELRNDPAEDEEEGNNVARMLQKFQLGGEQPSTPASVNVDNTGKHGQGVGIREVGSRNQERAQRRRAKITDFFSYYIIDSTVLMPDRDDETIRAAFCFYYSATR